MDPTTVLRPNTHCHARGQNRPGQYWYPFAAGAALHLPRVSQNLQRHHRHGLLSAAHLGRNRGDGRDLARPRVSRASDRGGVWV